MIIRIAMNPDHALQLLEYHFLDDRAKQVNDDVWSEFFFDLIRLEWVAKNEEVTHEKILNKLCTEIQKLTDIRTGSGHSSDEIAWTIAALCAVEAFEHLYRNSMKEFQALNSALRACTLEADLTVLRTVSEYEAENRNFCSLGNIYSIAWLINEDVYWKSLNQVRIW